MALASRVPMYFRVIRMPPVSARPWELMPLSHASSIQSWMRKTEGIFLFLKCWWPGNLAPMTNDVIIWMVR